MKPREVTTTRRVPSHVTAGVARISPPVRRSAAWRALRPAIAGTLLLGLSAACAVPARNVSPTGGDRIVLVVSGTANEPRPGLPDTALKVLRDAANSGNVTNQGSGKSSLAMIVSADGVSTREVVLTPRRADGSLEHGLQRPALIERNVQSTVDAVANTAATDAGLDLLAGIDGATRGVTPGTLVVVSDGLSTSGAFDLRQVGWDADPRTIAQQLDAKQALPHLENWHVLFTGLGTVTGQQLPLPGAARDRLTRYWQAICAQAHALTCEFDDKKLPASPPRATVATPAVPVPGVTSVVGDGGRISTSVSDSALGFAGDSAVLSDAAQDLLQALAGTISARLADRTATVTVRGYAADPPGSTAAGREALADQRARAVAGALTAAGVRQRMDVAGIGTEPGRSALRAGKFDEAAAAAMRRVEITY